MQMEEIYTAKILDEMGSEELARWLCLFEAVDIVTEKANKQNIDLNQTNEWIKPLSFKTYIKETYFSMLDKVCHYRNEIPRFDVPAYSIVEVDNQDSIEINIETEEESKDVLI